MRIGALVLLLVLWAALPVPARAADDAVFAPKGCDFGVTIGPGLVPEASEWGGRRTVSVAAENGRYAIRAACTTGYPAGALADLDAERRLVFVERLVASLQLTAPRIAPGPEARWIDVTGLLPGSGAAPHLYARILYGTSSRLMLEVFAADRDTARDGFDTTVATIEFRHGN